MDAPERKTFDNGLRLIIETVIFMEWQNIAFRGRRDDGRINLENEEFLLRNEINFHELLGFRANAGDTVLKNHLKTSALTPLVSVRLRKPS
jgi:hypothetical protein